MKAFAIAVLATSLVASASTPTVHTDFDPGANFASFRTYRWAMKPQGASPLVSQRSVDGIDARLAARGWTQA
ncbi:DUF4136 domain-containing protein, partial [Stenotrophomonas sp. SrG]|uniref:DUF4136 domain-containing protein n=1 Tax=Stenotrophomonas sp. SrG TaxID=3414430 RepID=UPI003CEB499C